MSRKLKHNRSSRTQQHEKADELLQPPNESDEMIELPPRHKKHPSSVNKVNKWYYNVLFILFVCLVAFLFWYGKKFST
ncbi:hypothetical protein [Paenibacillus sp. L3-i20]|uniref:hypothetical protein n=1 Tax=Paenibacillus sp. L3-i20 TaxID=2905833 RepID=UPI001EDFE241|nr:hypothetical protein [Paenibacillus sp. L3-i20]GKU79574.1 hypothetical protein L3i20_v239710 [Paenibacillus sp. L3-i20]